MNLVRIKELTEKIETISIAIAKLKLNDLFIGVKEIHFNQQDYKLAGITEDVENLKIKMINYFENEKLKLEKEMKEIILTED